MRGCRRSAGASADGRVFGGWVAMAAPSGRGELHKTQAQACWAATMPARRCCRGRCTAQLPPAHQQHTHTPQPKPNALAVEDRGQRAVGVCAAQAVAVLVSTHATAHPEQSHGVVVVGR